MLTTQIIKERLPELEGAKHVLILGYGREGQAVDRFLAKYFPKLEVTLADNNKSAFISNKFTRPIIYGEGYLSTLKEFDLVIRSPGIPLKLNSITAATAVGIEFSSLTNIFLRLHRNQIIGITGTKGKSTTSSLIAHILKTKYADVRLVGNIGIPALDALDNILPETIFVCELSSFQLENITVSPYCAVLLNIYPEHLDHHISLENYIESKLNITRHQSSEDSLFTGLDYAHSKRACELSKATKHFFSRAPDKADLYSKSKLLGAGNIENQLAAICVAEYFQVSPENIQEALVSFEPLEHRLEFVGSFKGIDFYNDSLSTIPEATINALDALGTKASTLIAGGFDRGLSYKTLGDYLRSSSISTLILLPTTGVKIEAALEESSLPLSSSINIIHVETLKEAVEEAFNHTPTEKACVMSPASSSFNMFKDYQDRGEQFVKAIYKTCHISS